MTEPAEHPISPRELLANTRRLRGGLASLRAAVETLQAFPDLEESRRQRLQEVVLEEADRLARTIGTIERLATASRAGNGRQRTTVASLLDNLCRATAERGLPCDLGPWEEGEDAGTPKVDVDLEALGAAVAGFAGALRRDLAVIRCRLGARLEPPHLLLELAWRPEPGESERLHDWHGEALEAGDGEAGTGLRPTARHHGGEAWFVLDRDGEAARARVLLPLVASGESPEEEDGSWTR
jgi:DNA polymerase-3 subunit epsilon